MLQNNKTELQRKVSEDFKPDAKIVDHMSKMGFHPEIINMSLRHASNNMDEAIDMLIRMQGEGTYENLLASICGSTSEANTSTASSSSLADVAANVSANIRNSRMEEDVDAMAVCKNDDFVVTRIVSDILNIFQAFERFSKGVSTNDDDYLDFALVMEENFIAEYKSFMSM